MLKFYLILHQETLFIHESTSFQFYPKMAFDRSKSLGYGASNLQHIKPTSQRTVRFLDICTLLPPGTVFGCGFLSVESARVHGLIFKSVTQFGRSVSVVPDCPVEISAGRSILKESHGSAGTWLGDWSGPISKSGHAIQRDSNSTTRTLGRAWLEFFPCNYIYVRWLFAPPSLAPTLYPLSYPRVAAAKLNHLWNEYTIYRERIPFVHGPPFPGFFQPCRIWRSCSLSLIYFVYPQTLILGPAVPEAEGNGPITGQERITSFRYFSLWLGRLSRTLAF